MSNFLLVIVIIFNLFCVGYSFMNVYKFDLRFDDVKVPMFISLFNAIFAAIVLIMK